MLPTKTIKKSRGPMKDKGLDMEDLRRERHKIGR